MATTKFEDNFDEILGLIDEGATLCVDQTVDDIVEEAQIEAPVLSGSLRDGIYGVHVGEDADAAHGLAVDAAKKANPKVETEPSPGVVDGEPDTYVGLVDVVAAHGSYIHNGANGREGVPFLERSGDAMAGRFEGRLDRIGAMLSSK